MLKLEIESRPGNWVKVSYWIFRSWAGGRRVNGRTFNGPCYYLGTTKRAR